MEKAKNRGNTKKAPGYKEMLRNLSLSNRKSYFYQQYVPWRRKKPSLLCQKCLPCQCLGWMWWEKHVHLSADFVLQTERIEPGVNAFLPWKHLLLAESSDDFWLSQCVFISTNSIPVLSPSQLSFPFSAELTRSFCLIVSIFFSPQIKNVMHDMPKTCPFILHSRNARFICICLAGGPPTCPRAWKGPRCYTERGEGNFCTLPWRGFPSSRHTCSYDTCILAFQSSKTSLFQRAEPSLCQDRTFKKNTSFCLCLLH